MTYLKLEVGDTIRFIPLDEITFDFFQIDRNRYQIDIIYSGKTTTLFEKKYITEYPLDNVMLKIMLKESRDIVTKEDLFS